MKISIITVCYNSANTIADAIRSVASQTHMDVEYLVVDGASTDATLDIVNASGRVSRLVSESDQGIYDAMNKGLAVATGDIVGFLNADDAYFNDQVLSHVAQVFEDSTVDACYSDLVYVDQYDTSKVKRYWTSRAFESGLFKRGWMPAHPTFFVRKVIYDRYGNFDLNYKLAADFELTMRLMEVHKIRTRYVPEIWIRMRMGGATNNSIKNVIKGNIESYKACRKNGLRINWAFPLIKILSRLPQFIKKYPK